MTRRICFDRIAFDIPVGFTLQVGKDCCVLTRNNPVAMVVWHNCDTHETAGISDTRLNGFNMRKPEPSHYFSDLFPETETTELFWAISAKSPMPGSYGLMLDLPCYFGIHMFFDFTGIGKENKSVGVKKNREVHAVGDHCFTEDLSIWRAFLSSMKDTSKSE